MCPLNCQWQKKFPGRWIMDNRYYTRRLKLSASQYLTIIFLDTTPCISEYRSSDSAGWDPCGTTYPTCSLSGGSDDFEGPCTFNTNVLSQDCSAQASWLKGTIAGVPKDDWLFVVGHHPADEINVEDMTTIIETRQPDLYLNGHTHSLSHYLVDGRGAYVTSGAGSLVMTGDQQLGTSPAKDRSFYKANGIDANMSTTPYGAGHTYQSKFNAKVTGFTQHIFSADLKTLMTQFIGKDSSVLYSFNISKGQFR